MFQYNSIENILQNQYYTLSAAIVTAFDRAVDAIIVELTESLMRSSCLVGPGCKCIKNSLCST